MINIIQYNLGSKKIVMENLLTEDRANEFLNVFNESNELPSLIQYKIKHTKKPFTPYKKRVVQYA